MDDKDRRIAENALLRELVNALQAYIAARDAVWALNFWDRCFRKEKCRRVFVAYDAAADALKNSIRMMSKSRRSSRTDLAKYEPLISLEEFEALMNEPNGAPAVTPTKNGNRNARVQLQDEHSPYDTMQKNIFQVPAAANDHSLCSFLEYGQTRQMKGFKGSQSYRRRFS